MNLNKFGTKFFMKSYLSNYRKTCFQEKYSKNLLTLENAGEYKCKCDFKKTWASFFHLILNNFLQSFDWPTHSLGLLAKKIITEMQYPFLSTEELGAKYLVFVSCLSLKIRVLSFAQFVYFLRKVCLFFNF